MDSIKEISISKIASVLSKGRIIYPKSYVWKEIFNNAGQSEIYYEYRYRLQCTEVNGTWGQEYKHNEGCYDALHKIFLELVDDFEAFTILFNNIANEINVNCIFNETNVTSSDIDKYEKRNKLNELLTKYPSKEFKQLRSNINVLGLDFSFDKEYGNNLIVLPFEFIDKSKDKRILIEWLEYNYPNILDSYEKAIKSYGTGDGEGTLSHCRSVLTGIFSYSKKDNTKWLTGLQNACDKDRNLNNIDKPNSIPRLEYIKKGDVAEDEYEDLSNNKKYNYPRFRTIYQVYSFLSDLGPHITEAPLVNGIPDYELTDMNDALMGLRMTEDILIWLYQCEKISL